MSPNKRIHIFYFTFTALTHCLMYCSPGQERGKLEVWPEGHPQSGLMFQHFL